ncbi:MAG: hypothetical protein ACRD1C_02310 [Terriglobales bacterium]
MKPSRIRQDAERPFRLELQGAGAAEHDALIRVFVPDELRGHERDRALEHMAAHGTVADVRVCGPRVPGGAGVRVDPANPDSGFRELLRSYPRFRLALARTFPPFRELLAHDLIQAVAARNAALAAISALPEVIPNPLSLLLALGEMGSDSVLLTANQVVLAFELAALRGQEVGWRAQSGQIGAILVGALGWRALARELVGLIPAGYGLAAKSGIAYSGTLAVGTALWHYHARARAGVKFPRSRPALASVKPHRQTERSPR